MKRLVNYIANFMVFLGLALLVWILFNDLSETYLSFNDLIPYIVVLVLFGINLMKRHKFILDNIYYSLALLFSSIYLHIVIFRSVFDEYMIIKNIFNSRLNLIYLNNNIIPLTLLFAALCFVNLFLILKSIDYKSANK